MNNKGYTLIEMLAVVVILAIIGGIATVGVINVINTSKLKSEKIFIDKLSNLIDDYLDLYKPTKSTTNIYTFNKCANSNCSKTKSVTAIQVKKSDGTNIYLGDLVDKGMIDSSKLVNPKNKELCLNGTDPEIKVYRDEEYVYYYYVDLRGTNTSCAISDENGIINTLPDDLRSEVGLS